MMSPALQLALATLCGVCCLLILVGVARSHMRSRRRLNDRLNR